jgi:hypothetical protein
MNGVPAFVGRLKYDSQSQSQPRYRCASTLGSLAATDSCGWVYSAVCSQLRSTRPCITIWLALPDSGRSFLQSTEIWQRRPVPTHFRVAGGCTAPTTFGSQEARRSNYPSKSASG